MAESNVLVNISSNLSQFQAKNSIVMEGSRTLFLGKKQNLKRLSHNTLFYKFSHIF